MQVMRLMIDVMAGGTLLSKTEDEAYNFKGKMTLNNYQWSNERDQPKRVVSKFDVDALTLLTTKINNMT